MKTVLVTGGAGFAGSNIAIDLKRRHSNLRVIALDNLKRRGSELTLQRLREGGVEFTHGDIRCPEDFPVMSACDLVVEAAAEPSVLAGRDGNPGYVVQTNLVGTVNCLDFARRSGAAFLFLSTSRVYPVAPLNDIAVREAETRFEIEEKQSIPGIGARGVSEQFPLEGIRTLYGATKLASELIAREYADTYGVPLLINRCGVLTGPWQMGKVDQGVVSLWVARHLFQKPLAMIGFGGTGKQVRDVLHIQDLCELLAVQLPQIGNFRGETFNVGGGREVSVSLRELTELCRAATGNTVPMSTETDTRPGDVPVYITDNTLVTARFGWKPARGAEQIVSEITSWMRAHRLALEPILT